MRIAASDKAQNVTDGITNPVRLCDNTQDKPIGVCGTNAVDRAVGRHSHADKAQVYFVGGKGLPPYNPRYTVGRQPFADMG